MRLKQRRDRDDLPVFEVSDSALDLLLNVSKIVHEILNSTLAGFFDIAIDAFGCIHMAFDLIANASELLADALKLALPGISNPLELAQKLIGNIFRLAETSGSGNTSSRVMAFSIVPRSRSTRFRACAGSAAGLEPATLCSAN